MVDAGVSDRGPRGDLARHRAASCRGAHLRARRRHQPRPRRAPRLPRHRRALPAHQGPLLRHAGGWRAAGRQPRRRAGADSRGGSGCRGAPAGGRRLGRGRPGRAGGGGGPADRRRGLRLRAGDPRAAAPDGRRRRPGPGVGPAGAAGARRAPGRQRRARGRRGTACRGHPARGDRIGRRAGRRSGAGWRSSGQPSPVVLDDTVGNPRALDAVFDSIRAIPHERSASCSASAAHAGRESIAGWRRRWRGRSARCARPVLLVVTASEDTAGPARSGRPEEREAVLAVLREEGVEFVYEA